MGCILSYKDFLKTYKTRGYRLKHLEGYASLFPVLASPGLAGIVADLMGDGHLQADPKWRIDFTSKEINELNRFDKEMNFLFNTKGKIRKCTSNKYSTYNLAINSSPISRILFLCGVPSGQKVLTSFSIPKWIIDDKECFRRFCQRLFTCEGSINHDGRKTPQIRLEMFKSEELIKKHFYGLGVPNPKLADRIGDYVLIMKENYMLKDDIEKKKKFHKADHGGVSREEMLVPLIVFKA